MTSGADDSFADFRAHNQVSLHLFAFVNQYICFEKGWFDFVSWSPFVGFYDSTHLRKSNKVEKEEKKKSSKKSWDVVMGVKPIVTPIVS